VKSLELWALSAIFGQGLATSFEIRLGIEESVESSLVESLDVLESLKILVSSKERFLTVKSFDEFDGFELLESMSVLSESLDVLESRKILVSSKERFLIVKSFDEFDGFELLELIIVFSTGKAKLSDTGTHGPSFSKAILYSIPSSSSDSETQLNSDPMLFCISLVLDWSLSSLETF
jgi:hypothetical protein